MCVWIDKVGRYFFFGCVDCLIGCFSYVVNFDYVVIFDGYICGEGWEI